VTKCGHDDKIVNVYILVSETSYSIKKIVSLSSDNIINKLILKYGGEPL